MNKLRIINIIFLLCLSLKIWANVSPLPMVEQSANKILTVLQENKIQLHNHPDIVFRAVKQYILPHVDVVGMSRSVLGRQAWTTSTPDERQQFAEVFTQLVIRTYASPLVEYTNETVKFLPIRDALNQRFLRLNSLIIRPNGKEIPLSYNLIHINNTWKIYDLSVEGISLLESFKSQFAGVLKNSNMKELIKEMRNNSQAKVI